LLQILTDDLDVGVVIYRSWSATDLRSLHRNRNAVYWKTTHFVIRCLRELHAYGFEHLLAQHCSAEARDLGRVYRTPLLPQMIGFGVRSAARSIPSKMRLAACRDSGLVRFEIYVQELRGRFISCSYLFVVEHDDEICVMPESAANRTVELYRATRFRLEWRLERLLTEDTCALDPTLLVHRKQSMVSPERPGRGRQRW